MKIEIKQDVFDITQRLKEIDSSYFVVFNLEKQKFELHSNNQPLVSYCLTFPFNQLDERAIFLAKKTLRQNRDLLIEEMERQNTQLVKDKQQELLRSYYGS